MIFKPLFLTILLSGKEKFKWTTNAARHLISLRIATENDFKSSKCHETVWRKINKQLKEAFPSFLVTWEQCCNKYKQAKRDWRAAVDNNNKSGTQPKSTPFDDLFDEAFGNKASTQPKYTLASMNLDSDETEQSSTEDDPTCGSSSESCKNAGENKGKQGAYENKKRKRQETKPTTLSWLSEYEERQSKRAEKMHSEKCELFKQLITALGQK